MQDKGMMMMMQLQDQYVCNLGQTFIASLSGKYTLTHTCSSSVLAQIQDTPICSRNYNIEPSKIRQ